MTDKNTYDFHHFQVTVPDVEKVEPFYDKLFSLLGFDINNKFKGGPPNSDMLIIEYLGNSIDFGISSPKKEFLKEKVDSRKPGAIQHIAFKADSRKAVDVFFEELKK